jgi:hypothetical protein
MYRSLSVRIAVSVVLTLLLTVPDAIRPAFAETAVAPGLNLVIVEGEGAINNVKQRTAREPVVQVEDENHKPVAGAAVLFTLPDGGPSGAFANGARTLKVVSDANGRAIAKGLRLNNVSGKFQIKVEASFKGTNASATISQTNATLATAATGGTTAGQIASIALAVGAAVAAVVVVATQHKNSATRNSDYTGANAR